MNGRLLIRPALALLAAVLVIAGCSSGSATPSATTASTVANPAPTPSSYAPLHNVAAGERLGFHNGLAATVPRGLYASFAALQRADAPLDSLAVTNEPQEAASGASLPVPTFVAEVQSAPNERFWSRYIAARKRLWTPLAGSADGSIAAWWLRTKTRHTLLISVYTRLPGKAVGNVEVLERKSPIDTTAAAYTELKRVWRLLSLQGASLPPKAT